MLGEIVQQLRRWRDQGKLSVEEFTQHIVGFRNLFELVRPAAEAFDLVLSLANRFSLSHWDSMLLGACKAAGVSVLYTEDMGAARTIDGVELVNPFV